MFNDKSLILGCFLVGGGVGGEVRVRIFFVDGNVLCFVLGVGYRSLYSC